MIRKFKTLGLALVAVLAMSAVVASAASAQFTADKYPTTGTATSALGNDDYKTEAGSIECASHYEGTLNAASSTTTLKPVLTGCKAFGFAEATINMNGCHYVLHRTSATTSHLTTTCPAGQVIRTTAGNCEVTYAAQSPTGSITTTNAGNNITLKANVTGIAYTVTKDGFLCPFGGTGAKTGATWTQNNAITLAPVSGGTDLTID